jgi:Uncharacterised protein family (UPF0158)
MAKAPLKVLAEELIEALETGSPELEWVLDLKTGKVSGLFDPLISGEAADKRFRRTVEANPDRFVLIEATSSQESFRAIERFCEGIESSRVRAELQSALGQKHPFRAFKDAVSAYPNVRADWFRFKNDWLLACARDWLEENAPNATLITGSFHANEA